VSALDLFLAQLQQQAVAVGLVEVLLALRVEMEGLEEAHIERELLAQGTLLPQHHLRGPMGGQDIIVYCSAPAVVVEARR
jgi:hypothetical protein